ncbi:MAG: VCBS repeat-containing protein [Ginsengibacter sp.]
MKRFAVIFCIMFVLIACNSRRTLFKKKSSSETGITFNNQVIENDSINPIDMEFLYNGNGVVAGDFNNDDLPDLYFTASMVSNKLYLNKGNFKFEDVTEEAHVNGEKRWCNGASSVDINNDGLLDIYVCASIKKNPSARKNLFFINQGINKNGVPVFKEMAEEYHLADTGLSVQAAFFDYDNDGDLDMYLVQTMLANRESSRFMNNNFGDTAKTDVDKLYRNDWNKSLRHPVFTDVSSEAGIVDQGFGLGVNITDFNNDGWKDIYVTNDFFGSDLLYINNKNGTFTNKAAQCFKHTSQNAMGNDVADINNDGLPDVIAVDMNPEDNYRKKKNMGGNNYYTYQSMLAGGYVLQYVKNTLQLNMGARLLPGDSIGEPVFADIAYYAGVAETDWSWHPCIADFDNDGYRDIFITNGYPRDVTDHDFAAFRNRSSNIASKQQLIDEMPQIKISNYAYHNKGNLQFENVSKKWGLDQLSFSNGSVYADLDNDGDFDYVISNINDEAFVFENTLNTNKIINANFLKIKFKGERQNRNGLGAVVTIFYDKGKMQVWENSPCRGYLSCVESSVQFGLAKTSLIDSVIINWSNNKTQKLINVKSNQALQVNEKDAKETRYTQLSTNSTSLFTDVTNKLDIHYRHYQSNFIDFNYQRLLPHKVSEYGPGIAAGDIDGNGYDDLCIGGSGDMRVSFLLQQADGKFVHKELPYLTTGDARRPVNVGILLFDADNDSDLDLYLTSGGSASPPNSKDYQDRIYKNDGKGNYTFAENALPADFTNKSCVKAADIDNDGHPDLFIGGRVVPGHYPQAVNSFIYRNDSKNGVIHFTDVTEIIAPELKNIGLTCDGIWTDFNNDGWKDLVVVGEWMAPQFFKNEQGKLKNITSSTGLQSYKGWWNSIVAGDFDNDGDMDYVIGNLGTNSYYRGTDENPAGIYAGDFVHNNGYVAIPSLFLPDQDGNKKEFPAQTRDDIADQLPALKKKFLTYKEFGKAGMQQLLDEKDIKSAYKLQANYFESAYLQNIGKGKFTVHALPMQAQIAPIYGMVAADFNNDGNLDIAAVGNDFGTEVSIGRYDAMNGLIMLGDGKGNFAPQSILQSGFFVPGNARGLVKLIGKKDDYLLAATQNRDALKVFKNRVQQVVMRLLPGDEYVIIHLKNGQQRKEEIYNGDSFVSQSSKFIIINNNIESLEIIDNKKDKRMIKF